MCWALWKESSVASQRAWYVSRNEYINIHVYFFKVTTVFSLHHVFIQDHLKSQFQTMSESLESIVDKLV